MTRRRGSTPFKPAPVPWFVAVGRLVRAGWFVPPEIQGEAAALKAKVALDLREPLPPLVLKRLVGQVEGPRRGYAAWLKRKCESAPLDELPGIKDSLFLGAHFVELNEYPELLDALTRLVAWRLAFDEPVDGAEEDLVAWD